MGESKQPCVFGPCVFGPCVFGPCVFGPCHEWHDYAARTPRSTASRHSERMVLAPRSGAFRRLRRVAVPFMAWSLSLLSAPLHAQTSLSQTLAPDTWVATDALGRTLPMAGTAPTQRTGKYVGVFYFLWHGQHGTDGPFDNTQTVADPIGHPYGPPGAFHWWGEPAVGYFLADDPWVHRKNLQMLADARVDVIFFDVTNSFTYPTIYPMVCKIAEDMRRHGIPAPQIAFITHAGGSRTVTRLYDDFYSKGLYKDLWFRWEGKPLILGNRDSADDGVTMTDTVKNFFTWRNSWAWDPGHDKWQWIDKYPQRAGWHDDLNKPEEVPVAIAGHPTDSLGRSYHSSEKWGAGTEPPVDAQYRTSLSAQGLQFAQQWERALQIDPQFIFLTGWNEWVAQRFLADGPGTFAGHPQVKGGTFFVDNFTEEFSRDAMPMKDKGKGGYGDNYYLQMVAGIRRFKGVHALPIAYGFQTMPGRNFAAWSRILPEYRDAAGDTEHRDHNGWGKLHYKDTSGRNDITLAKVACDTKAIYFYVQTASNLTAYTGAHWMQILIDADSNAKTGWNGYEYVVNCPVLSADTTTLKRFSDGEIWVIKYHASGKQMMLTIPRRLLGLTHLRKTSFDFHWVDNAPVGGDPKQIAAWWYVGDSAPDGRFNYRYQSLVK